MSECDIRRGEIVFGAVLECVNVTSGEGRLCLELFQNVLM